MNEEVYAALRDLNGLSPLSKWFLFGLLHFSWDIVKEEVVKLSEDIFFM